MTNILKVRKPSDFSSFIGQTDTHDLVSVINFSELSPVPHSLNRYEVYGLFLQGNDESFDLIYGTGKYDYSAGTLICVAPGQIGGKEDNGALVNLTGWALLFHPDILQGTGLEKEIKNFSFFDYRINEALHMSEEERDIIIGLFRQIETELRFPPDAIQNRIIAGFINLVLRYAKRFYERQFVSRTVTNNDILTRFEKLLQEYFAGERQLISGVPTVKYCAEQLNMSATYLSDVVRKSTGETANHHIKQYMIQLAKNRLVSGMNSSEVAYSLGFDYPQHFSRTFKKITGETPSAYCERRTKDK
ncbi:MAG: helix-turn-helix domain-containing protein [Muribaculaceae bacterium]|nr:helix-turn-helix domain-containing protein [Muribaculaceae bacterium]